MHRLSAAGFIVVIVVSIINKLIIYYNYKSKSFSLSYSTIPPDGFHLTNKNSKVIYSKIALE